MDNSLSKDPSKGLIQNNVNNNEDCRILKHTMNPRKIIHIDMDYFFVAIELLDRPHLRGQPVAVGGAAHERGVLSTCNYEARQYGLHSAMSTARAQALCPQLILLPPRFDRYRAASQRIYQIFTHNTPIKSKLH